MLLVGGCWIVEFLGGVFVLFVVGYVNNICLVAILFLDLFALVGVCCGCFFSYGLGVSGFVVWISFLSSCWCCCKYSLCGLFVGF